MKNLKLEEFYHINARKLASLRKANIDVMNPYAVKARILGQNRRPPYWTNGCPFTDDEADAFLMENGKEPAMKGGQNDPPTSEKGGGQNDPPVTSNTAEESLLEQARKAENYDDARFFMTKAKALKETRQLQILEEEYVNNEEVIADFTKLGYALRGGITRMANDLAPALAGLNEVQCAKKIKEAGREIMVMLGDQTSDLYKGAEENRFITK